MKRKNITLAILAFLFGIAVPAAFAGNYLIGPGDVLEIAVWKNPDLTKQVVVLPDGRIHFPLVKSIKVEGITVEELETILCARLKDYVPEPDLFISIAQVNSMMVYIVGKVNKPGRFPIYTNIDVLQALAMAGGVNPFAKEKEINIFRKTDDKMKIFSFNYKEVSEGENLEQNIMLNRGDVIVVR